MASQTALCNVNDLGYQMFRIKKGNVDSGQRPPCKFKVPLCFMLCGPIIKKCMGERTGLVVRASNSGSGDPGSILGRVSVLLNSLSKRHLLPKSTGNTQE